MSEQKVWYKKGSELLYEISLKQPGTEELYAWYIGQCGFVFKRNEKIFYMDPVLNDLAGENGVTRRYYTSPYEPSEVKADYVICTHAHADHMALPTLAGIAVSNPDTRFIVPAECIPFMTEAGIPAERIIEAKAGVALALPDAPLTLHPVAAAHPTHRKTPEGGDTALSYLLDFDGIRVLHMGDTYLTDQLYADLKEMPAPDLFLPPINGGDYFRTARNCIGNLSAIESARLAVELGADLTIPTHYDMVMDNTVDPLDFVRELRRMTNARQISRKWKLPELGERVVIYKQASL